MNKRIVIVKDRGSNHHLTVTPTTINISVRRGAQLPETNRVIRFFTNIARQKIINNCISSFSKKCSILSGPTDSFVVQMVIIDKNITQSYHEDLLDGTASLIDF